MFTIYESTDASAPVLNNVLGGLLTFFNACLVTGYGSKPAAGWSKPTGDAGNIGYFRQGRGSMTVMMINDNSPTTNANIEAYMTGFEQYPNTNRIIPVAGINGGNAIIRKTASNSTTGRPWIMFADEQTFYLFINTGDGASTYQGHMFGQAFTVVPTIDDYLVIAMGNAVTGLSSQNYFCMLTSSVGAATTPQGYTFRSNTMAVGGTSIVKRCDLWGGIGSRFEGVMPYPNPTDGGVYMCPIYIHDMGASVAAIMRGRLRGIWMALHSAANFTDRQVLTGVGEMAGRSFTAIKTVSSALNTVFVETSNTLETNF